MYLRSPFVNTIVMMPWSDPGLLLNEFICSIGYNARQGKRPLPQRKMLFVEQEVTYPDAENHLFAENLPFSIPLTTVLLSYHQPDISNWIPTNTSQVVCSDTILALLHQTCPGPHLYSLLVSSRKTSLLPLTPRPIHPKVHQFLPQKKKKIELKSTPSCHLHSH